MSDKMEFSKDSLQELLSAYGENLLNDEREWTNAKVMDLLREFVEDLFVDELHAGWKALPDPDIAGQSIWVHESSKIAIAVLEELHDGEPDSIVILEDYSLDDEPDLGAVRGTVKAAAPTWNDAFLIANAIRKGYWM